MNKSFFDCLESMTDAAKARLQTSQFSKTYADSEKRIYGCCHYQRSCKLFAKCCNAFVTCRLCHDDLLGGTHKMDRCAVTKILCMDCGAEQNIGPECNNPDCETTQFASYYCNICHLYDSSGADFYHCQTCGICRRGTREEYFHCEKCNMCVSVQLGADHQCTEGKSQSICPCCLEDFTSSCENAVTARCGHSMHDSCWDKYTEYKSTCPVCLKTLTRMDGYYRSLDKIVQLELSQMPAEYQDRTDRVYCQDCGGVSTSPFHFHFHKCTKLLDHSTDVCGSYNTRLM